MFASGFDITTAEKVGGVVEHVKKTVGIRCLRSLHVNDVMRALRKKASRRGSAAAASR